MANSKNEKKDKLESLSFTEKAEIVGQLLGQLGIKGIDAEHLLSMRTETDAEGRETKLHKFDVKKQVFISAYIKSFGNITRASMAAKVTRKAYYYWMEHDSDFADYINNLSIQDVKQDFIESKLMENVNQNDTVAIIYADKRTRGYLLKREIFDDNTQEENVHLYLPDNKRDSQETIDTDHEEVEKSDS